MLAEIPDGQGRSCLDSAVFLMAHASVGRGGWESECKVEMEHGGEVSSVGCGWCGDWGKGGFFPRVEGLEGLKGTYLEGVDGQQVLPSP